MIQEQKDKAVKLAIQQTTKIDELKLKLHQEKLKVEQAEQKIKYLEKAIENLRKENEQLSRKVCGYVEEFLEIIRVHGVGRFIKACCSTVHQGSIP